MILIPVKNLSNAKQRLGAVLSQAIRTELAHVMLADVLLAVSSYGKEAAALVTNDPYAIGLSRRYGFEIIRDEVNRSETDAIAMATNICVTRGIDTTLVIPGDIPLIEPADIAAIYEHAPARGSLLVPSADERGTNAVLRRPAGLFPLRFGNDSFIPHRAAAQATGNPCVVISLPRIGLDIDMPDDLHQLAQAPGDKPSQLLARKLGFGTGPASQSEPVLQDSIAAKPQ